MCTSSLSAGTHAITRACAARVRARVRARARVFVLRRLHVREHAESICRQDRSPGTPACMRFTNLAVQGSPLCTRSLRSISSSRSLPAPTSWARRAPTSAPGLDSPLPHLRRSVGTGPTPATSALGLGAHLRQPHLRRDWAHIWSLYIWTQHGEMIQPPLRYDRACTSAPKLGPPLPTSAPKLGPPLPTSAPGLSSPARTTPYPPTTVCSTRAVVSSGADCDGCASISFNFACTFPCLTRGSSRSRQGPSACIYSYTPILPYFADLKASGAFKVQLNCQDPTSVILCRTHRPLARDLSPRNAFARAADRRVVASRLPCAARLCSSAVPSFSLRPRRT